VHRAGFGDGIERGIDDGVAHAPADHVVLAAVDLAPLHATRPERRIEVAGKGVERLVVVVVGIEGEVIELGHDPTLLRLRPPALAGSRDIPRLSEPPDLRLALIAAATSGSRGAYRCVLAY